MMQRNDIDPSYTWDLSPIFRNREEWDAAYSAASELTAQIPALKGTLGASASALCRGLKQLTEATRQVERVYLYAMLYKSLDNGDPAAQEMEGKAVMLWTQLSAASSFVDPEILSLEPQVLQTFLEDPCLAVYRHMLEDTERARQYTLNASEEKLLALLSDAASAPSDIFDLFESVDLSFPDVPGENGTPVKLTHGSFSVLRESKDRSVRKAAFKTYFGAFRSFGNTLAATYAGSVKLDNYYTQVRGYESACQRALFASNVPVAVYDSLVDSVHAAMPLLKRYLELRRKVLGLEELHMYDLYCPIVAESDRKMEFEEAKKMVREACRPLGEEYCALLDRAYRERWIDVFETKGKTTGAYSCGVYGVHPYVLLNFSGTLDDAFTLAHELGHAMHSYRSDAAQDYVNHDYRILVAEVASTVNEVLLTLCLLAQESDPRQRAYLLNHFLEGFRTTVFRQTLFAEFERKVHDWHQSGNPLTAEVLSRMYRDLNLTYYNGVTVDEFQDIEWARIPHFYNAFYVYQYATGFCSAVSIVRRILQTGDASGYLQFLSSGGSDYPLNELKMAGIDLTSPTVVRDAMAEMETSLAELEAILLA